MKNSDPHPPDPIGHTLNRRGGRRPRFSVDDVIATALDIGIDIFSISGVARKLKVTAAAVYRRFPTKEALATECLHRILATAEPLGAATTREEILRQFTDAWWTLTVRFPGFGNAATACPSFTLCFDESPLRTYSDELHRHGLTEQQSAFSFMFAISMLQQIDKYQTSGNEENVDLQLSATRDFIVASLSAQWPEWSMPLPWTSAAEAP